MRSSPPRPRGERHAAAPLELLGIAHVGEALEGAVWVPDEIVEEDPQRIALRRRNLEGAEHRTALGEVLRHVRVHLRFRIEVPVGINGEEHREAGAREQVLGVL